MQCAKLIGTCSGHTSTAPTPQAHVRDLEDRTLVSGSNFELGGVPVIVPYIMPMRLMGDIRDAPEVLAEAGDVLGTFADAGSPRIRGTSCSLLSIVIMKWR